MPHGQHTSMECIVTVCVFVRHLFSWYPFYFDFHSARIIFDVSSGFYLWNINNTKADICTSSVNCVNWDGTEVLSCEIPNEENLRKIAIDRNGNVYVAGKSTNTIQRLHSNGTVDCVVLNEGDIVDQPLSICFNTNCDKLYMANIDSPVVHVYSCSWIE
jgi:hypothetical protein